MSRLINQVYEYDQGIAAVAMAVGKTYGEVRSAYDGSCRSDLPCPLSHDQIKNLLSDFGYDSYTRQTLLPVPSIVFVPSLNRVGRMHCVYYDGRDYVYDPQKKRSGKLYYNLKLLLKGHAYSIIPVKGETDVK